MMKAFVLNKGRLEQKQMPIPEPGKDEILVKLQVTGVCRTDLHTASGQISTKIKKDLILGHEGVGTVETIGNNVHEEFKAGDLVVVPWLAESCKTCDYCLTGWDELCSCRSGRGMDCQGCYAEYIVANSKSVVPVPAGLAPEQAAPIACAGLTTYKAMKESGVRPGQWCVVFGAAGGLGHVAMQYASAMGMKVIGVDIGDDKLGFIRQLGFEHALDAKSKTFKEEILKITKGKGAHGCVVTAPSPDAYKLAMQTCRRGGTISCVALPHGELSIPMMDVVTNGLRFVGTMVGNHQELVEALEFAADGKVHCVVAERKLSEISKVHEELKKNSFAGRAVCHCDENWEPSTSPEALRSKTPWSA